ncbi:MAG TPA: UDP-N-acetylmuramate--L-alanine ligase, partial [Acidobacteriota bacterium]|nr:UDP-N-acetylmuramate--L-alanine ligase [Acidobacteriota bacterium]
MRVLTTVPPTRLQADSRPLPERLDEAAVYAGLCNRLPANQPNPKAVSHIPGTSRQPHPNAQASPQEVSSQPTSTGRSDPDQLVRPHRRFHFVGIGGAGMSAVADQLLHRGCEVTGSDLADGKTVERLRAKGAVVHLGHRPENIEGAQFVVISSAVPDDNPESVEARKRGIPVLHRSEVLAALMADREGIAVAGTHGKSTTTALVAHLLKSCSTDPSAAVGADVISWSSNSLRGQGLYFVAEADESDRSFLRLPARHAVVTNIDWDHPDTFRSLKEVEEVFSAFLARLPEEGLAVVNAGDPPSVRAARAFHRRMVTFGLETEAQFRGEIIRVESTWQEFEVRREGRRWGRFRLPLPGRHNVANAVAALALTAELSGLPGGTLQDALADFRGLARRLEVKGERDGVLVIDDYGHHPREVTASLEALRSLGRRIVLAFQPHRYTRTRALADAFGESFRNADVLFLLDIYSAGEPPIEGVDLAWFSAVVARHHALQGAGDLESLLPAVRRVLRPGDLLVTMGAGDVWRL